MVGFLFIEVELNSAHPRMPTVNNWDLKVLTLAWQQGKMRGKGEKRRKWVQMCERDGERERERDCVLDFSCVTFAT